MRDLRRRVAASLALLAIVAGSCAVPTDDQPGSVALDPDFAELLDPAPTTEASPTTVLENQRLVGLYFIVDDTLARRDTGVAVSRAESLTAVLTELAAGTRLENHRSAIPSAVVVASTSIDSDRRVATITLADNTLFTAVEGRERQLAIAQLVFTTTGNRFGVDAVQFEIDGNIRSVPTPGGSDKSEPVGRCDYERFAAPTDLRDCPGTTTTTNASPTTTAGALDQVP